MHVGRGGDGLRRLTEIAVLSRADTGLVQVITAWHVERGWQAGQSRLRTLIDDRRQS